MVFEPDQACRLANDLLIRRRELQRHAGPLSRRFGRERRAQGRYRQCDAAGGHGWRDRSSPPSDTRKPAVQRPGMRVQGCRLQSVCQYSRADTRAEAQCGTGGGTGEGTLCTSVKAPGAAVWREGRAVASTWRAPGDGLPPVDPRPRSPTMCAARSRWSGADRRRCAGRSRCRRGRYGRVGDDRAVHRAVDVALGDE